MKRFITIAGVILTIQLSMNGEPVEIQVDISQTDWCEQADCPPGVPESVNPDGFEIADGEYVLIIRASDGKPADGLQRAIYELQKIVGIRK